MLQVRRAQTSQRHPTHNNSRIPHNVGCTDLTQIETVLTQENHINSATDPRFIPGGRASQTLCPGCNSGRNLATIRVLLESYSSAAWAKRANDKHHPHGTKKHKPHDENSTFGRMNNEQHQAQQSIEQEIRAEVAKLGIRNYLSYDPLHCWTSPV